MTRHVSRRIGALVTGLGVAAAIATPAHAAPSSPAVPEGLKLVQVRESLLGTHTWYEQTYNGVPVLGGFYATHKDAQTGAVTVDDGRKAITGLDRTTPGFAADRAQSSVAGRLGHQPAGSTLVVVPGTTAKLAWDVRTRTPRGTVQTVVDASTGSTLKEQNTVKEATGVGTVFDPNPVVALQNESLTDQDNADQAALRSAYKIKPLTRLDGNGTKLVGAYADNISEGAVTSPTRTFFYNRSQAGFEQVEAYYSITGAEDYIHQLGFRDVNNEPQDYTTVGFEDDNSYYDPDVDGITFGTGGVDDAEDNEVIWHEYGHAIQDDQVPGFGSTEEAGAIGEGFGDYWAFTMSQGTSRDTATTPLACIADWDSTSYTDDTPHCLRRTDGTKMYPADLEGEVHADGEIWSRALWDVNRALGRTTANRIVLESQFGYTPTITMPDAAKVTVATAKALYGPVAANKVRAAFHARGIL
jgi:Zn-dependent metalloprotease